jgi:RNA polymerase sporulation-specific sigma factor
MEIKKKWPEKTEQEKADNYAFIKKLDACAIKLQTNPNDEESFEVIHLALHKFIISQAFHRFIIRGHEGKDLYQESLIVLWQKAIPSFDPTRGMSFWGFAKMCINRHLITILNSALNRKKDMPMNRSISLDEVFNNDDEEGNCSLQNVFEDHKDFVKDLCLSEDKQKTVDILREVLSPFESMILYYYLEGLSYKEISIEISEELQRKCNEKSVDNALLRIRRKAFEVQGESSLPLFTR